MANAFVMEGGYLDKDTREAIEVKFDLDKLQELYSLEAEDVELMKTASEEVQLAIIRSFIKTEKVLWEQYY